MVEVYLFLFILYIITCVKGFPFVIHVEICLKLGRNIDVNNFLILYYFQDIIDKVWDLEIWWDLHNKNHFGGFWAGLQFEFSYLGFGVKGHYVVLENLS